MVVFAIMLVERGRKGATTTIIDVENEGKAFDSTWGSKIYPRGSVEEMCGLNGVGVSLISLAPNSQSAEDDVSRFSESLSALAAERGWKYQEAPVGSLSVRPGPLMMKHIVRRVC